jgi:hypothetical protein
MNNGVEMSLSDTQTLRILRSTDGPDVTSNDEMAQGLEAIATKFKEVANDLRTGKLFSCPVRGGAAFAGTHVDGSYHIDIELVFVPVTQPAEAAPH